jgi:hypothetical protein
VTTVDLGLPTLGGLDLVPTAEDVQKAKDFTSDQEATCRAPIDAIDGARAGPGSATRSWPHSLQASTSQYVCRCGRGQTVPS